MQDYVITNSPTFPVAYVHYGVCITHGAIVISLIGYKVNRSLIVITFFIVNFNEMIDN